MIRLFVSVNVNEPEIVKRIMAIQQELLKFGEGIKLTEPENLHFTLKFIGEVDDARALEVEKNLEDIRLSRFRVNIKGIGYFPGGSRVRIIWVGAEGNGLLTLAREVQGRLRGIGEEEEFVAHLTIARVKWIRDPLALVNWLSSKRGIEFGELEVNEFYLMKSTLLPRGPVYTPLMKYALG